MQLKRVVVTGIGALTPIGNNVKEYWEGLSKGKSGAGYITKFDPKGHRTMFACELKDFNIDEHLDRKDSRKMDLFTQYGMVSTIEAMQDSAINPSNINLDRVGVIWGSGVGGLKTLQEELLKFYNDRENPKISPYFIPKMITDIVAGFISIKYGFRGPNFCTTSACGSSSNALIDAYNYIRLNKADIIVAGGSEMTILECGIGGFNSIRALSERNDSPETASRPFDKNRDGFVMGEGAGTIILEEYEHAIKRGAKIYAEFKGGGMSADAYHITAPHPQGIGARNVMINALNDMNMKASDIDYINVHGTSTPLGDISEAKAIGEVFNDDAYKLNISSTKSMTGHLLGAAGVVEAIASILAIQHSIVPPTINHFTDDKQIDKKLNFTFNEAQAKKIDTVMSNTFGFGGHNFSIIFSKLK